MARPKRRIRRSVRPALHIVLPSILVTAIWTGIFFLVARSFGRHLSPYYLALFCGAIFACSAGFLCVLRSSIERKQQTPDLIAANCNIPDPVRSGNGHDAYAALHHGPMNCQTMGSIGRALHG